MQRAALVQCADGRLSIRGKGVRDIERLLVCMLSVYFILFSIAECALFVDV